MIPIAGPPDIPSAAGGALTTWSRESEEEATQICEIESAILQVAAFWRLRVTQASALAFYKETVEAKIGAGTGTDLKSHVLRNHRS